MGRNPNALKDPEGVEKEEYYEITGKESFTGTHASNLWDKKERIRKNINDIIEKVRSKISYKNIYHLMHDPKVPDRGYPYFVAPTDGEHKIDSQGGEYGSYSNKWNLFYSDTYINTGGIFGECFSRTWVQLLEEGKVNNLVWLADAIYVTDNDTTTSQTLNDKLCCELGGDEEKIKEFLKNEIKNKFKKIEKKVRMKVEVNLCGKKFYFFVGEGTKIVSVKIFKNIK